jgi:hypothetical protein
MAQVVTVAAVVPKKTALVPCASPKDAPTPGMIVNVLPAIPTVGLTHAICNEGVELTVRAMVVVADRVPEAVPVEVPWIVIVAVPVVAELLAVKLSTLLPVVGFVPNAAVTPLGIPEAVRVTGPVNPPTSLTLMVSVPPAFRAIVNADAEGANVKLPVPEEPTVSATGVDAVSVPEVPVMVTVDIPAAAVLLAANVTTLVAVAGLVPNVAVTPLGKPDAARVTAPANPPASFTAMASVPLAPGAIDSAVAEDESVKLGVCTEPQAVPLIAKFVGTALAAPLQVPLNPMPVRLPAAGMAPL